MRDEHSHPDGTAHGAGHAIALRPAIRADVPAIVALEHASFAHAGERFDERRVQHLICSRRTIVTVAHEQGAVLGWVAGFSWLRGRIPWGRVYAIAVDPRARGRRLGKRLMESVIHAFQEQGANQVYLEVRPDNQAGLRLYHNLGFAKCCALPDYYGEGMPAIRMVRLNAASPAASP